MNYETFLELASKYHYRNKRDTTLYFEVLKIRNIWDQKTWDLDFVRWIFQKYLLEWGGMARVYPLVIRGIMYEEFLKEIPVIVQKSNHLFNLPLISSKFAAQKETIAKVYEDTYEIHVPYKNGIKRMAATGASKILHFLVPNLFIIWDHEIVRKRQIYGTTSDEYLRYLGDKRELLQTVVESFIDSNGGTETQAVEVIENRHAEDLSKKGFEKFPEPITKLLDEINYFI